MKRMAWVDPDSHKEHHFFDSEGVRMAFSQSPQSPLLHLNTSVALYIHYLKDWQMQVNGLRLAAVNRSFSCALKPISYAGLPIEMIGPRPGFFRRRHPPSERLADAPPPPSPDLLMRPPVDNPHFSSIGDRITVDFSPNYSFDRRVAWAIQQILPHAQSTLKFVLILREPVARSLSNYAWVTRNDAGYEPRNPIYAESAEAEMKLLRLCYNATLAFQPHASSHTQPLKFSNDVAANGNAAGAAATPQHASTAWCRTAHAQYAAFAECVRPLVGSTKAVPNVSWFEYLFHDKDAKIYKETLYEGILLKSMYVDNIVNFLCAGFKPEQFIIVTNGELNRNYTRVMERLSKFVENPAVWLQQAPKETATGHVTSNPVVISDATRAAMHEFFEPYNRQLLQLLMTHPFHIDAESLLEEFGVKASEAQLIASKRRPG